MGYKPINYNLSVHNPISSGIDTLVMLYTLDDNIFSSLKRYYSQYPVNSNFTASKIILDDVDFQEIDVIKSLDSDYIYHNNLDDWAVYTQIDYRKDACFCNVRLSNDEFAFPAIQFMFNEDFAKTTFYGLFYRICELYNLDRYTFSKKILAVVIPEECLFCILISTIIRLDYRRDLPNISVSDFIKTVENQIGSRLTRSYSKETLETFYIGTAENRSNRFRIYNKLLDSQKKGKDIYYADYFEFDNVTRVEIETHPRFIGLDTRFEDYDKVCQKISSFVGFSDYHGPYNVFNRRTQGNVIFNPSVYIKQREKRTRKLLMNGFDLRPSIAKINRDPHINFVMKIKPKIRQKKNP